MQVDILSNESELHEVTQFVRDNAQRALGVGSAQVLPVSSRRALEAKLECGSAGRGTWVCIRWCSVTQAGSPPKLAACIGHQGAALCAPPE